MLRSGSSCAWIEVDGTSLETYSEETNQTADGKTVTCWIPSTADKHFAICWSDSERATATKGVITVDGNACGTDIIFKEDPVEYVGRRHDIHCGTMQRPFIFSDLQVTDDDAFLSSAAEAENIGEISVQIWRIYILSETYGPAATDVTTPGESKVHERSKKAGSHCVKYGAAQPLGNVTNVQSETIHLTPEVTFVFRYRPLGLLQANGIAPPTKTQRKRRAKSPNGREFKPDIINITGDDDDDDVQIKILQDQIKRLQAKKSDQHGSKRAKTVKQEQESNPSGVFQPGEVIDLT